MPFNIDHLSDKGISLLCHDPKCIISGDPDVRCLARISNDVIVKCGWSVTPEEAANHEFAYGYSSRFSDGLKVPRILRYFKICNVGYLVMEFVEGVSLEKVSLQDHPGLVQRLARAIYSLFQSIPVGAPGPINGGIPRGYLFSEYGAGTPLNTITKLNQWLNKRALFDDKNKFAFTVSDCRFCHLDLTRRNIILCPDGSFCLLDWEHAGFYPAIFEIYCLLFTRQHDYRFTQELLDACADLSPSRTEHDDRILGMLDRVYRNNLRYSL